MSQAKTPWTLIRCHIKCHMTHVLAWYMMRHLPATSLPKRLPGCAPQDAVDGNTKGRQHKCSLAQRLRERRTRHLDRGHEEPGLGEQGRQELVFGEDALQEHGLGVGRAKPHPP